MKKAVFVLGTLDYKAARRGEAFTDRTYALLEDIADSCRVDAEVVVAVQDPWLAGKAKHKIGMEAIRGERGRVLDEIGQSRPDFIMCFGPVASASIFGKGNLVESELLRQAHYPLGEHGPPVYVTFGMENVRYKDGLRKWLKLDVCAAAEGHGETKWGNYEILQPGSEEWDQLPGQVAETLEREGGVGFDLETYPGLDPWAENARIRMVAIGTGVGRGFVVQATHDSQLPDWVVGLAENPDYVKAGSNIKYDYVWMRRFGYRVRNMWDTSTAEHILDESNPKKDLKSLTFRYAPWLADYSKGHRDLVRERGGWEHVEDNEMYQYAGADGEASFCAWKAQLRAIDQQGLLRPHRLFKDLYEVLAEMEYKGACINMDVLEELDEKYKEKLAGLRAKITEHLGPINPNSPTQLADALREAVPGIKLTKSEWRRVTGNDEDDEITTTREVLEREASKHPVIGYVLEYRKYRTRHSTFITSVRDKHARQWLGRTYIHPRYRTDVVETYRLSSQSPNGQNIPRKDNDDPELTVKQQFVSRFDGGKIVEGDLSQIEIRMAAELSQDRALLDALESGEDVHTAMACKFFGKDSVTKEERRQSKTLTFLILYGGGAQKLRRSLGVSLTAAKRLISDYYRAFPGLRRYIDQCRQQVKVKSEVETVFGFRRHFVPPEHWDSPEGWSIERKAFNTKVQNAAACVTAVALIQLAYRMRGLRSCIELQVHDSIVVDTHPEEVYAVTRLLSEVLSNAGKLASLYGVKVKVPLDCDIEIGESWGTTQPWNGEANGA